MRFSTSPADVISWDAAAGGWHVSQCGTHGSGQGAVALRRSDGTPLLVHDVLVQRVGLRTGTSVDVTGARSPVVVTVGSGDAVLLRDGARFAGRWSRASATAPTTWTDAAGGPLNLAPGGPVLVLLVPKNAPRL